MLPGRPPPRPFEVPDPLRDTEVCYRIIVYGSCSRDPADMDERFSKDEQEQRRLEVQLGPVIPASKMLTIQDRREFIKPYARTIIPDLKHNKPWRCEFCTKFAREAVWMNSEWLQLKNPNMISYVHLVCNSEIGDCAETLSAINSQMQALAGAPPTPLPKLPREYGLKYPMAASCVNCNSESKENRKRLKQCNGCKLTRHVATALFSKSDG
ncbi:hypothetical protein F5880DRAFT_1617118 [Lentinula raphanica]|nr:hypothetical protein F5880DRAFT_1617118 [Lentinula raphanica]